MSEYYDRVYYHDFCNHAVKFFYNGEKYYPGIDMEYLFNLYFSSRARYEAELGSPYYLNIASGDLYREFEEDGIIDKFNYPKSDKTIDSYYGDALMWIVMQWSHLAFKYKIHSKDLLKFLGFREMLEAFIVGHERDFDNESEILFDRYVVPNLNRKSSIEN